MVLNADENFTGTQQQTASVFDSILASVQAGIDVFRQQGGGADVGGNVGATGQHNSVPGSIGSLSIDSGFLMLILLVVALIYFSKE